MRAAAAGSIDRSAIEAHQIKQLQSLLSTLLERNPFYSAKLKQAAVRAEIATLEQFTERALFTSKSELAEDQAQHPPYGTNLSCPLASYTRFNQTSGTTGRPMKWLDTPESWDWMIDCWTRVYESAGIQAEDRIFFPFSFGPFLGFWVAFDAATRTGSLAISGGGMRSEARLKAIVENEVTALCVTPTYALHLAEVAAEQKLDLGSGKVRRIIVAGEPGGSIPATRALIEQRWPGARVIDHHGMTEIGPVTYECPEQRGTLHVMEAAFLPEVLHPDSHQAVGPGEIGELVLTNFGRVGSPLLRYRTGDMVRRGPATPCVCGSSELALPGGILARRDGMVVVRGVNVYPSAVEDVLRSCGVVEFRVETHTERSLVEMGIQIECESEAVGSVAENVASALRNALGLRVAVECVARGSLPRFEGKANRWVRL